MRCLRNTIVALAAAVAALALTSAYALAQLLPPEPRPAAGGYGVVPSGRLEPVTLRVGSEWADWAVAVVALGSAALAMLVSEVTHAYLRRRRATPLPWA